MQSVNAPQGQSLAAPIAIHQDIKRIVDHLGIDILDLQTLADSPLVDSKAAKKDRELPLPDSLIYRKSKIEKMERVLPCDK